MADPNVEKIFHAAGNDIALLRRDFGFEFVALFDTHLAAGLCGRTQQGLQALLEGELGISHGKALQRCDWSLRPLSPAQEHYATEDVRHLVALRDKLRAELRRLGREAWAQEEFEEVARTAAAPVRDGADFWSAKGARDLDPRGLAVLRELFQLRDEWARRSDRPLFKVVGDQALMTIAQQRPKEPRALGSVPGLPLRIRERRAVDVIQAVRRAEALPESDLPRREKGPKRPRMGRPGELAVERLKAWRTGMAPRVGLDPGVLLPNRLIEAIGLAVPDSIDGLSAVPGIRRWRIGAFGVEMMKEVAGTP